MRNKLSKLGPYHGHLFDYVTGKQGRLATRREAEAAKKAGGVVVIGKRAMYVRRIVDTSFAAGTTCKPRSCAPAKKAGKRAPKKAAKKAGKKASKRAPKKAAKKAGKRGGKKAAKKAGKRGGKKAARAEPAATMIEVGAYKGRDRRVPLMINPTWTDKAMERGLANWSAAVRAGMSKRELAKYGEPRTPTVAQVRAYLATEPRAAKRADLGPREHVVGGMVTHRANPVNKLYCAAGFLRTDKGHPPGDVPCVHYPA